jgi:hypothetical protein
MPISEEVITKYNTMVRRIASEYANKYKMVERADLEQEMWMWFVSHPAKTKEWSALESKDSDRLFAKSLRNAALDYSLKEKAVVTGYEYEDNFWYTKEFIKLMLPASLSDDWKRVEQLSSEVKSVKSPSESGDWMAHAADVKKAYETLNETEQALVLTFYAEDATGETLHEQFGEDRPSSRATMMAANRALNKMVKALGGFPPFRDRDLNHTEQI